MNSGVVSFWDAVRSGRIPKLVIGLLAASLLAVLGSLFAGLVGGELRGQLSFGLIAACALIALATALSMRTTELVAYIVWCSWFGLSFMVLAAAIILGADGGDIVLTYAMGALSFPVSTLVAPFAGSLLGGATLRLDGICVLWLALFAAGYVQWFVVFRRLFRNSGGSPQG